MCSKTGQDLIKDAIKAHDLTGVVICSCSPRMHEATFRKTVAAAGLNPYMLEVANIREQCSWVHKDIKTGTQKAIVLARAAVAKVHLNAPLTPGETPVTKRALVIGVFDDTHAASAAEHLVNAVTRENIDNDGVVRPPYSLMTGFIGTAWISQALSMYGKDRESYRLLQNGEYPSWIYSVRQGATTIWERLNSYTKENGFGGNNSMNSFNHYSFGAVAAWMMMYSLGIMRETDAPGFTHFTLCPTPDPDGKMTWAKGHAETLSGKIESRWAKRGSETVYTVTVPAGTSAALKLTASENAEILESGKPAGEAFGVKATGYENGRRCFELLSGTYEFTVRE